VLFGFAFMHQDGVAVRQKLGMHCAADARWPLRWLLNTLPHPWTTCTWPHHPERAVLGWDFPGARLTMSPRCLPQLGLPLCPHSTRTGQWASARVRRLRRIVSLNGVPHRLSLTPPEIGERRGRFRQLSRRSAAPTA
jgi:hypothetical protein